MDDYTNSVWWGTEVAGRVYMYEYLDPWGNPYRYFRTQPTSNTASEGKGFDFWLVSNGPDGKPGFARGSKDLSSGNDDGDGVTDEIDGSEDGAKSGNKYSDDVVNWR